MVIGCWSVEMIYYFLFCGLDFLEMSFLISAFFSCFFPSSMHAIIVIDCTFFYDRSSREGLLDTTYTFS